MDRKILKDLHPALETLHRISHSAISIPHSSLHPALRTTHSALDCVRIWHGANWV